MRGPDLRRPFLRLSLLRTALCLGLLAVAARAAHLSLIDERGWKHAIDQIESVIELLPARGDIVDRRGQQLAVTVMAPSVVAEPRTVSDRDATAAALAEALGVDPARVAARLSQTRRFSYVARWVTQEQADRIRALKLPGIGITEEPRRVYPFAELASQIVGFSNIDGEGVRGIEEQEDAVLRGEARKVPVERDGRQRLLLSETVDPYATVGGSVTLTLDAAFQADAETALDEAMATTGSASGLVLSLDPRTGEVFSLAERPAFDPNRFREASYKETRSRALLDAYEPGSTFKIFLMAAALEAGAVAPGDRFDCERGKFWVPGKLIRDSHPYGVLDLHHVLWKSSNIGVTKIAYKLGPDTHYRMLDALGFGRPTGSGFPQESSGLLRDWKRWRRVDRANIAFGQGVNVTALQLAAATAAIANGGIWVQPHFVLGRRAPGGELAPAAPPVTRVAMRPETAALVLSMMEGVTGPEGTGKRAALAGIRVAGKTGTAQKLDPRTGTYSDKKYLAWFVGAAPVEDPRLVMVVMLDEPKGIAHTGGAVAAPVFAKAASAQLARLGITGATPPLAPPVQAVQAKPAPAAAAGDGASAIAAADAAQPLERFGDSVLVPDFTHRTIDEVRRETIGILDVVVSGEGRAVAQEPPPGTIVNGRGRPVLVRFERGPGEG
ncbi:MAG: penicillin-binding protein [Deltaproteobacteria bacterium]|nr:penicillin-binding protein [Deltaproteobacteria bacterium]